MSVVHPRDATATRARILAVAQGAFSRLGYAGANLRLIAADAHVDPVLIARYFGSKRQLFETSLRLALDVSPLMEFDRARFGQSVMDHFARSHDEGILSLTMVIRSVGHPEAQAIAVQLLEELVIQPLARWLSPREAKSRAVQVTILCTGYFLYRNVLPLSSMPGPLNPAMRRWFIETLQAVVDR